MWGRTLDGVLRTNVIRRHATLNIGRIPWRLAGVLPPASSKHVPEAYRHLMTSPLSPILEYYPKTFETDLNGKKNGMARCFLGCYSTHKCGWIQRHF